MIKQVPALLTQAPAEKDRITRLAAAATDMVRARDANRATGAVDALDAALRAIPDKAKAETAHVKEIAKKAADALEQVGNAVTAGTDKLLKQVQAAYADHGFSGEVDKFFKTHVQPAVRKLADCGLDKQLKALAGTDDPAERAKLLKQSLSTIEALEKSMSTDPVFKMLDDNPFAPAKIAQTTTAALEALKKTLQPLAA